MSATTGGVNLSRIRASESVDSLVGADGDDPIAFDRDGISVWIGVGRGKDLCVDKDQVGHIVLGLTGTENSQHSKDKMGKKCDCLTGLSERCIEEPRSSIS